MDDTEARAAVDRLEDLLEALDGDERALDAVQALVEVYGEGLARIAARAPEAIEELARDELVGHLLLLHDLHPVGVEERVGKALDEVRPYLGTHGGNVELLGVEDGVVHLRLEGSCSGCPSSRVTLEHSVEEAIHRLAPEVQGIEAVDGAPAPEPVWAGLDALPMACPAPTTTERTAVGSEAAR